MLYKYVLVIFISNLASVLAVEGCWVGCLFFVFCCDAGIHWSNVFSFLSPFSPWALSYFMSKSTLWTSQITSIDPVLFDILYIFCHHNSTWLHLNKHVIYCTRHLESSEVICSHSEKTSFPYVACYTERVMGFARVSDFPKGYRTKLCTLLFTHLNSL